MNKEQQIEEIMMTIPQIIVAYNGDPKGQHLYGEQRLQIAEVLYNAGYRKVPKGSFICSGSETNLDVEVCNNCGMQQADELFERDKEIERLKAENERFVSNMKNVLEIEKENAVKEFAEKLKEKTGTSFDYYKHFQKVVLSEQIDGLLKEYEK